ncbi:MAG: HAD family hydrolase [Pseudomonadota bacterium]
MLKAVLLDLDNTLILFDEPGFYQRFFDKMATAFHDLMPADQLARKTVAATVALKENDGRMVNRDWFNQAFTADQDLPMHRFWDRWLSFYRDTYGPFGIPVTVPPGQADTIDRLAQSGLTLAIASNPIFPRIALERRMAWGGLDPAPFALLTHMDNMSFVKPREGYYRSISEMLDVAPETCLMVGNDPVNDMAAAVAGMSTYLTTDGRESDFTSLTAGAGAAAPYIPDFSGPLSGVLDVVARLQNGHGPGAEGA